MDKIQHILTTVIAVCSSLVALGLIFNWLLNPVKEAQADMKADIKEIKTVIIKLNNDLNHIHIKAKLK